MKIRLIPSSISPEEAPGRQFLTSYLINEAVAIDAGCIGLFGTPEDQARLRHVFISHTHVDHVASLPFLLENVYEAQGDPLTVYGGAAVLACLQQDLFNERLWPDFIALSSGQTPLVRLVTLQPSEPVHLEGLRITPVPVDHTVPTFGFVIEDGESAVIIVSDTGPTEEIWEVANRTANLKGVFLEAAFPNALEVLAERSKHLTPALFAREVRKLTRSVPVAAVHLKPRYYDRIAAELHELAISGLSIGQSERPYFF